LKFEWDPNKNQLNQLNHGVAFEEAKSVFDDENAFTFYDIDHSYNEDRFIIIGMSIKYRELMVCHCVRTDDAIRIISARKTKKGEAKKYNTINL